MTTSENEPVDLDEPADDAADTSGGNSEAAKYRVALRAKETENTVLTAKVDAMLRTEIQRLAANTLADGGDFWREPVEIADLCDEVGLVDAEKVRERAEALTAAHAHWARKPAAKTPPASVVTSSKTPFDVPSKTNWIEAITGGGA